MTHKQKAELGLILSNLWDCADRVRNLAMSTPSMPVNIIETLSQCHNKIVNAANIPAHFLHDPYQLDREASQPKQGNFNDK